MRLWSGIVAALALVSAAVSSNAAWAAGDTAAPATAAAAPDNSWVDKLPHQTGQIDLGAAKAKLN
ncbi:MAG: hypothetical protein JWP35_3787, partial [Caulobacter sp.]|nr:hypothetical protein [Caulobacter sp.]